MTKEEIDKYFTKHFEEIQQVVRKNAPKCVTSNQIDITSDIYLVCLEKAGKIKNLAGFIRILASNIYRWDESLFNIENKVFANEIQISDTYTENECKDDEIYQRRMYALELYKLNAKPHELRFYEFYIEKRVQTVRGIQEQVGVSFHGAYTLIKDFKLKMKEYERKAEIS